MTDREVKAKNLRTRAEKIVSQAPDDRQQAGSAVDLRQTLHELRVHQVELEMQNDELIRAHRELEAMRARYFDLYELAPAGYITLNGKGLVLESNLTAASLLGVVRASLISQSFTAFISRDDQDVFYRYRNQLSETDAPQSCELRMVKKDGTTFWARLEGAVPRDAGSKGGFRIVLSDISDRKQVESSLRLTVTELARSNRDLEQFAYVASHDMKEPLRMITGFLSLLRERCQSHLDSTAKSYIGFAEEGGMRMQRLVDDLLAYASVGRGNLTSVIDVNGVLDQALKKLQAPIEESGVLITRDSLPVLHANEADLVLLFQHLLDNAIKFRRPDMKPEIQVGAVREGDDWIFRVSDNGIGIAPEYREKVFLIFHRLHVPEQYPGMGIGLAICRKIVERLGGTIWVEARDGGGSVFAFSLPA